MTSRALLFGPTYQFARIMLVMTYGLLFAFAFAS